MLMYHKLSSVFLILLPISFAHAAGNDREISPTDVCHILDRHASFVSHVVARETRSDFPVTVPHKPVVVEGERQNVRQYTVTPLTLDRGEQNVTVTVDERKQVQDTKKWPMSPHGHLDLFFGEGHYGGSGVLVGPYHVLTCAHNVYVPEKKTWVTRLSFYPGLNDGMAPFDAAEAVAIYVKQAWIESADPSVDVALVVLKEPIGRMAGFYGLACADDHCLEREIVDITGYPGDKGARQMWTMSSRLKTIGPNKFEYVIDTYAGQSGSGICINPLGSPYVIGVHTRGGVGSNSGVRITQPMFDWFVQLLTATQEVRMSEAENPSYAMSGGITLPVQIAQQSTAQTLQEVVFSSLPTYAYNWEFKYSPQEMGDIRPVSSSSLKAANLFGIELFGEMSVPWVSQGKGLVEQKLGQGRVVVLPFSAERVLKQIYESKFVTAPQKGVPLASCITKNSATGQFNRVFLGEIKNIFEFLRQLQ